MIKNCVVNAGISAGIGLILSLAPVPAAAQQAQKPASGPAAAAAGKKYVPPKTPWGEPDLQGIWPLNHLIATPLQRPEKYGDRRFLSEEELAAAKKSGGQPQQAL